jgi:hypothetical protein
LLACHALSLKFTTLSKDKTSDGQAGLEGVVLSEDKEKTFVWNHLMPRWMKPHMVHFSAS